MRIKSVLILLLMLLTTVAKAEDATKLFLALRSKVLSVKDYTADVRVKIEISYMKIPQMKGILYFKAPDKMRLERNGGVSLLPKKNINLTLSNLIPSGEVMVIDAGYAMLEGKKARLLKVIPENDDLGNIVLTKVWVDEVNLTALRTETTTKNDGTVVMDLEFGNYIKYGLPDKVVIHMDVKDYKLPKSMTMDYNDIPDLSETKMKEKGMKTGKGVVRISYLKYDINKGLSDAVFASKNKSSK